MGVEPSCGAAGPSAPSRAPYTQPPRRVGRPARSRPIGPARRWCRGGVQYSTEVIEMARWEAFRQCPGCGFDFASGEGERSCSWGDCPYLPEELNVLCDLVPLQLLHHGGEPVMRRPTDMCACGGVSRARREPAHVAANRWLGRRAYAGSPRFPEAGPTSRADRAPPRVTVGLLGVFPVMKWKGHGTSRPVAFLWMGERRSLPDIPLGDLRGLDRKGGLDRDGPRLRRLEHLGGRR